MEPIFIELELALSLHEVMIEKFGGAHGIRDAGVLESALGAPQNSAIYEGFEDNEESWARLAGYYWFAISQNHPFIDGNKRTSFAVSDVFLQINGLQYALSEDDVIEIGLSLAASGMSREELLEKLTGNIIRAEDC